MGAQEGGSQVDGRQNVTSMERIGGRQNGTIGGREGELAKLETASG